MMATTTTVWSARRRELSGVGIAAAVIAAGVLPVAPVAAQDCEQQLAAIERQMQGAQLDAGQQRYIRDLIDSARTFATEGNQTACADTVGDIAEYAQEESLDMAIARQANDRAPFVADTPENLREQPPQPRVEVPEPEVRVGEADVPLPVPDADVTVENAEPEVTLEAAEPAVTVEQAEPNVTIEQAEPRVTIERVPATGTGG